MAAHCINDVITCGAEPLVLLDYVAADRIDLEQVAELVEGAAEVCRAAGCRAHRRRDGRDAGRVPRGASSTSPATCVGVVDRDALIDGSAGRRPGDVVLGFPSAGVHANGFTLVRRVLEEEDYDGADLLAPTRLYLDDARRLRGRARAFAHVTGGGIRATSSASSPTACAPRSTGTRGSARPCSSWLARHVDEDELRRVFNLGIGFCAVVARGRARRAVIGRIA